MLSLVVYTYDSWHSMNYASSTILQYIEYAQHEQTPTAMSLPRKEPQDAGVSLSPRHFPCMSNGADLSPSISCEDILV